MKYTYPIDLLDYIPVLLIDSRRFILDTGSPFSVVKKDLEFCGQTIDAQKGGLIDEIGRLMGKGCDGLIGLDRMEGKAVVFNYRDKTVTFNDELTGIGGTPSVFRSVIGQAIMVEAYHEGTKQGLIVDSGAKISYLDESLVGCRQCAGEEQDYYPGVGTYTTPVYDTVVDLSGNSIPVRFGILPIQMSQTLGLLKLFGVTGILGFDLFRDAEVMIDFKNNRLEYKPFE